MNLAEVSRLLAADPKWVLNTLTALQLPPRYSLALAKRLAVTLAIHKATGVPLVRGFAQAEQALRAWQRAGAPVVIPTDDYHVALSIDVHRILSSLSVRWSMLRTTYAPRQPGRPPTGRRAALQAAADWGIDLTLIADNLGKTGEQRLRQLDRMGAHARSVRRLPSTAG